MTLQPSKKYFESIYNMRIDEIPDSLLIYYQREVIKILLTYNTWTDRCTFLKPLWSGVHTSIEKDRRKNRLVDAK